MVKRDSSVCGTSNLVVLLSLRAVAMYSDSLFSIRATLIQARPWWSHQTLRTQLNVKNDAARASMCSCLLALLLDTEVSSAQTFPFVRDFISFSFAVLWSLQKPGTDNSDAIIYFTVHRPAFILTRAGDLNQAIQRRPSTKTCRHVKKPTSTN